MRTVARPRSAGSLRLLPLAAILVPVLMLAGGAWISWNQVVSAARLEMQRTATAGAQYMARTLDGFVVALGRINEQLRDMSDDAIRGNAQALAATIRPVTAELPQSGVAYVIDRNGAPLLTTNTVPLSDGNLRDREYFQAMAVANAPRTFVSHLFSGRANGVLQFSIVLRRTGTDNQPPPEGGFDGVILISINPSAIADIISQSLPDPRDSLVFTDRSLRLVVGSTAPTSAADAMVQQPAPVLESTAPVVAVQDVAGFEITAIGSRPREVLIEQWRRSVATYLIFGLPASLVMLWLSLRVRADQLRLDAANAQLISDVRQGSELLSRARRHGLVGTFDYDLSSGLSRRSAEYMSVHGEPATPAEERHADWLRRLHPDDRSRAEAFFLRTLADPATDEYGQTYRTLLPNGEVRWIAAHGEIERDEQGRAVLLRGAHVDVTPLRTTELALAESDAKLRLAQEAVEIGTFEWHPAARTVSLSRKMVELCGFEPDVDQTTVAQLAARVHPAHRWRLYRQVVRGRRFGRFRAEFPVLIPSRGAATAWLALRARRLRPEDGPDGPIMGVAYDITERKRAEETAALLAHEVEHRAKNVLTVVTSMLRVTSAESLDEYIDALEGRVRALAGAMALLGKRDWTGATLHELAARELLPFGATAVLEGPEVLMLPDPAQALSMALHELTTNAAKYGALSRPQGQVRLRWWLDGELVRLEWVETGGPPVPGPPAALSFGSMLIQQTFESQLDGGIEKHWEPAGLVCRMHFRRASGPRP